MSDPKTLKVISQIQQQPQRQDSLAAQLVDLKAAANRLGLYDAAGFISQLLDEERDGLRFNRNERTG